MNRPFILIRILGAPVVALPLFLFCCVLLVGCYQGHTPWQYGFLAAGVAFRTLTAANRMRSYKAWRKEWQAMEPPADSEELEQSRGIGKLFTAIPLLFAVAYPFYLGSFATHEVPTTTDSMLTFLWCLTCLYLVIRLVWFLVRRRAQHSTAKPPEDDYVGWMIDKASSSPTRASATRALPEYCARLLSITQDRKRLEAHRRASLATG